MKNVNPTTLALDVTYRCNLNCTMCTAYCNDQQPEKSELSVDEILKITLDYVESFNITRIRLMGGEPFIRSDIFEIISALQPHIETESSTNATMINDQFAERIVESGLEYLKISIDGMRENHEAIRGAGTFDKAVNGIKALEAAKKRMGRANPVVRIGCAVNKSNIDDMEDLYLLAQDQGIGFTFWPMLDMDSPARETEISGSLMTHNRHMDQSARDLVLSIKEQRQSRKKYREIQKRNGGDYRPYLRFKAVDYFHHLAQIVHFDCDKSKYHVMVGPDGNTTPCEFLRNYSYGNSLTEGAQIWNSEERAKVRKMIKEGSLNTCQECNKRGVYRIFPNLQSMTPKFLSGN